MGVLGLWQLIESAGRPVALETLEGKILAVDASILLNQAIKGMKDKQGRTIANAHLAVLFHRVCKLLFYRIKPVFVFDGGAPELKRHTLMRRQQRRNQAAADMVKASENALKNLLKQRALEEVAKSESCALPSTLGSPANALNKEKARGNLKVSTSSAPVDMYELPPLPANTLSIADSSNEDDDDDDNDPVGRFTRVEDADEVDTESSEFLSLPLELQHEILTEVKDLRKSKRRVNWQDLPKSSDDFAKYQMSKLVKHSKLTQKITDLRKTMKSRSAGLMLNSSSLPVAGQVGSYSGYDVDANRIASEDHSHYILLKNVRHDRPASTETESAVLSPTHSATVAATAAEPGKAVLTGDIVGHSVAAEPGKPSDGTSCFGGSMRASIGAAPGMLVVQQSALEPRTMPANRQLSQRAPSEPLSVAAYGFGAEAAASVVAIEPADAMLSTVDSCLGLPPPADIALTSVGPTTVMAVDQCIGPQARCESTDHSSWSVAVPPTLTRPSPVTVVAVDDSAGDSESDDDDSFVEVATTSHGADTAQGRVAGNNENDSLLAGDAKSDIEESNVVMSSMPPPPAITVIDSDSNEASEGVESFVSNEWSSLLSATQASSQMPPEGFTEDDVHRLELALETERAKLTKEQRKQEATAMTVTEQMVQEAQELLKLFGVPFVVSPSEAEAQCATLEALGLCHGIVTDDSDVWLFGGHIVYKNFFKQDKFVELYKASDIQNLFGLNRNKLIALALVSGSDYTDGIDGAGPVTAMEILSEFNGHGDGITCLKAFTEWWQMSKSSGITAEELPKRQRLLRLALPPGFPEDRVTDAYLKPVVDSSSEAFTWASPELHLLRNFALDKFGWQQNKTDDMILPMLQRLNQRQSQLRIDAFFVGHGHGHVTDGSYLVDKFKSKRVKKAASVLLGNNAVVALQSGSSTGSTTVPSTAIVEPGAQRLSQQKCQKRTATGKSRRKKKSNACVDLASDAFSDSGDDALIMAAMEAYDGEVELGCSSIRNDSNDSAPESRIACGKKNSGSTRLIGTGRTRSRATTTAGQPNAGPSTTTLSKGRGRSGCSSEMKARQRGGGGQRKTAAVGAGRLVQASVDLSESSSDSE